MKLPMVLYVDDEALNLELLKIIFMNEFNIITATSAAEGLELLEAYPDIYVIISDLKMPVMNGLEFIKEIKRKNRQKVCMLLTGFIESEIMLEGFNKDLIFRYLMKPFNRDELEESILEAFRRSPEMLH
ncbi:MAG: response regulator [Bacteroidota bacterium]